MSSAQMNPYSKQISSDTTKKHEKFYPAFIDICLKNSKGVMVLGGISSKRVSQLKLVNGTINSQAYWIKS